MYKTFMGVSGFIGVAHKVTEYQPLFRISYIFSNCSIPPDSMQIQVHTEREYPRPKNTSQAAG